MRSIFIRSTLAMFVVAAPMAVAGVAWWSTTVTTSGLAPESMRKELAQGIVQQWADTAGQRYRLSAQDWAKRMAPTLRHADIANLERAASSIDFDQMNRELLGGAVPTKSVVPASLAKTSGVSSGTDLVFTPVTACRIVDTRLVGGPIAADGTRDFAAFTATDFTSQGGAAGDCGIPENASAVIVKVTSVLPAGNGYLTAYPSGESRPLASSLNYTAHQVTSNEAVIRLCRPGCAAQFTLYSYAQGDVVVDVAGYYMEPVAKALDCTVAQQVGNLDLLSGLQTRSVSCPAGYTATGGGCGGPLGIGVSNSQPLVSAGQPTGWSCGLVGSLLSVISYQVSATCCRTPGR